MLAVGDNPMIVHDAQTFWLVLLCEERRRVITYIIHALKIAVVPGIYLLSLFRLPVVCCADVTP